MKMNLMTIAALFASLSVTACNKDKGAESPDDGPMEEAGEWTDDAAEDTADAVDEAAEETSDELDDPETE
jgi:hypothetical protein